MKGLLASKGIKATPKYIADGSLRGTWRIYDRNAQWRNNFGLWTKLMALGFTDYSGGPLDKFSGNGGLFSIFARYKGDNADLLQPVQYNYTHENKAA